MASKEVNCYGCENKMQGSAVIEVMETFCKSSVQRKNKGKLLEGLRPLRRGSDVTTSQTQL